MATKIFIDNSDFLELVCELTDEIVVAKFGEEEPYQEDEEGTVNYTEEAQDFFNNKYDEVETILNRIGNIHSDIEEQ